MGFFSSSKKPCPICGEATPRILPAKVEGAPICKACAAKVDLPDGTLDRMTLEDLRHYLDFYGENQALRAQFTETYRYTFGILNGSLLLDTAHRLFRLQDQDTALVFEAPALKAFLISEDGMPLFEGGPSALKCYQSDIPARVGAMGPQLAQFQLQLNQYEQAERMMERDTGAYHYTPKPDIDLLKPFQQFRMELLLDHPYWGSFTNTSSAPGFNATFPSLKDYLQEYNDRVNELYELAQQLMRLLAPNAPEIQGGAEMYAAPLTSPSSSAADELMKYKSLLDSGAITEEEYSIKKRQLLGI